jgi:hydroxymethylbilane synthase
MAKLDAEDSPYAALILAKAGVLRLGWKDRISSDIAPPTLFYAVSQGALAVEIRMGDAQSRALCRAITHWQTEWRCAAERACLRVLEGGCSVPVGVNTELVEEGERKTLKITGCVTSLTGDLHVEHALEEAVASVDDAEAVGARLAKVLIETGAREILDDITKDREKRIGEAKTEEEKQKIEAAIAA